MAQFGTQTAFNRTVPFSEVKVLHEILPYLKRTLNLTDAEMRALDDLSVRKDLTKTAVLRQALRLYQTIEARVEKGEKLVFENDATKEKAELMLL